MRRHLYGRKKTCPMSANPIQLTNEIRDYILENRVYHIPTTPTLHQTINNYNTVNNVISGMELQDKIMQYMDYTKSRTDSTYHSIEKKLERRAITWKENRRPHMCLAKDDIMEVIDDVTCITDERLEDMNIVYDSKYDKLKLYDGGLWRNMLVQTGCKIVLQYVQEHMLDMYECYLAKRMHDGDSPMQLKQKYKEALIAYYKFLSCFDIEPYAQDGLDADILDDEARGEERMVAEEMTTLYHKTAASLVNSERSAMKKEVISIFKRNSRRSIDELNKKLVQLFHMDEEFRTRVTSSING